MGGYIAQLAAINFPDVVERLILISTSADHRPYMAATMGQGEATFDLPRPGSKLLDYIRDTAANPPHTAKEIEDNLLAGWEVTYGGDRQFPRPQLALVLRLAAQRSSGQVTAFNHALAVAASPERLASVRQIQVPTLIIHGKHDVCLPLAHGEYLARNIPGAQLKVLEMGHTFMWSWSDEVLDNVIMFLGD
jgi:pimeloyl-ACP methyl ester carboxylesterase